MQPILYMIIPCYNEEKVLPISGKLFLNKLLELIGKEEISDSSRILFVNDGSKDSTWEIIRAYAGEDYHIEGICQSRNRGHQNALLAGLMEAKDMCDITVSMDCDGQDDINAVDEMLDAYKNGCEVVYGVRKSRESDSHGKRLTAEWYYRILLWLGADIVYNHADYRLLSKRVLEELACFREVNLFLRGIVPMVGFKSTCVYYERRERIAGKTHYPLGKMLALAFDGITSLSVKPIRLITMLGLLIATLSFAGVMWSVVRYFQEETVAGWASMTSIICFIGGVQLVSMGVLGEYIGKIYMEVKARPRYIISERTYEKAK